ncbi:DUF2304 domain-containing protein [Corynebacterium sp. 13CS0277]|uniref:DUF2304 domain-containing protein n=1 Tax=Corynebacterium sp. 13CS0277 TaxID=2071994 RepID=UPI000D030B63|nr:DUF2304 domain-containing protein [Corynebacterium sp. 13CS0277]PRQ12180.1 DUF2304 domain-containing protein [Corynebacterium sp. 13CS0277]
MTGQLLIQLLLLASTGLLVAYFIGNRRKARAKAGVKLGFVLFILASIYTVLHPDDLTWVANLVGVARGTDLLLYGLVVAFMFTTLSSYIRFREQELRYARLARAIALQNAIRPEDEYPGTSA